MADSTRKRQKAARHRERQRRAALAAATKTQRRTDGPGHSEPPPPPLFPGDFGGGAGVREPRRPRPGMPAGALTLEVPPGPTYLDFTEDGDRRLLSAALG